MEAVLICICGQRAEWEQWKGDEPTGVYLCRYCKPDPWTSGSPQREGRYYRPIGRNDVTG